MKHCLLLAIFVFSLQAHALNDPMRPPFFDGGSSGENTKEQPNQPLELSMILAGNERKVAILNGVALGVGENVDGYRLLRIDSDRVVVSRKGRVKEVFLGKPQQQNKTQVGNRNAVEKD